MTLKSRLTTCCVVSSRSWLRRIYVVHYCTRFAGYGAVLRRFAQVVTAALCSDMVLLCTVVFGIVLLSLSVLVTIVMVRLLMLMLMWCS